MFDKIKNALLSKLISSLLPKYAAKYQDEIFRIALSVNMILATVRVALPLIPDAQEQKIKENIDYVEAQYRKLLALIKQYTSIKLPEEL